MRFLFTDLIDCTPQAAITDLRRQSEAHKHQKSIDGQGASSDSSGAVGYHIKMCSLFRVITDRGTFTHLPY